jgi:hypothetical protein
MIDLEANIQDGVMNNLPPLLNYYGGEKAKETIEKHKNLKKVSQVFNFTTKQRKVKVSCANKSDNSGVLFLINQKDIGK